MVGNNEHMAWSPYVHLYMCTCVCSVFSWGMCVCVCVCVYVGMVCTRTRGTLVGVDHKIPLTPEACL